MYRELAAILAQNLPQMDETYAIGKTIGQRPEKGAAVAAAAYLQANFPDYTGFSPRNVRRMRDFYRTCENDEPLLRLAMKIGWTLNVVIMEAELTRDERKWYLEQALCRGWSKTQLLNAIRSGIDSTEHAMHIQNNPAIITAKKANLKSELAKANIYLAPHENFADNERIRFGFDQSDLQQYMRSNLHWDPQVIDNDALAIWETHMRRQGNYSEYCGTGAQLPVFVTTNTRLIGIALKFREDRAATPSLYGWKQNRLPVITDIRLTCRLWSPANDSERMSLLYLTANAVAAKRPTKRYLNSIREFAIQLGQQAPEYSDICLSAYFDDMVTDTILNHTMGDEDNLDINSFASSIAELSEWKAREQEKITSQVIAERDSVSNELKNQTQSIINGAVESGQKLLGWRKTALWFVVKWPVTVTVIFSAITAGISLIIGNWHPMWAISIPAILKIVEICGASNFVSKPLTKWLFPKIDASISKRISKKLRKVEQPHKDTIIRRILTSILSTDLTTKLPLRRQWRH